MTVSEQMVPSADGTAIGFFTVGSGPPVVVVHGAFSGADRYIDVADALADHCSTYVMDRRGRGRSGDADGYSADREIEDIHAVMEAAGPDVHLVGHSSGAIYALEAARQQPVQRLVLYEPPLHFRGADAEAFVARMDAFARDGRPDDAIRIFLAEQAGLPDDELDGMRDTPEWNRMVELVGTFIREWTALFSLDPTPERYEGVMAETLLLAGSASPDHHRVAVDHLEQTLPSARTSVLEGHGHLAHVTAPNLLARQISDFLIT